MVIHVHVLQNLYVLVINFVMLSWADFVYKYHLINDWKKY